MSRRTALLAGAAVVALSGASLVFRTLLSGTKLPAMGDDVLHYHYPSYLAIYRHMAAGELPIWNPYQLGGVPWLAAIQSGAFYPPHLLHLLVPPAWAIALSMFLHLSAAAIALRVRISKSLFVSRMTRPVRLVARRISRSR